VLGTRGSQILTTQIFTEVSLDADAVAAELSGVIQSTVIAANLFNLLTKIAQGVATIAGVPEASGMASLLNTIFSEVHGNGGAPNLSIAVGEVKGQLATIYSCDSVTEAAVLVPFGGRCSPGGCTRLAIRIVCRITLFAHTKIKCGQ
jgi:hypothetical protein